MTINEFADYVCAKVGERLGKEYSCRFSEVTKNNGVVLTGVSFYKEGDCVLPTIYMENFHEEYEMGRSLEDIIENMIEIFSSKVPDFDIDFGKFDDYETIRDKIYCKVVSFSRNVSLINECPHEKILDLCVLFYVFVEGPFGENGSILIKNDTFESWNITGEELYDDAVKNTKKMFDVEILNIADLLKELMADRFDADSEFTGAAPMFVMTNKQRFLGASCILYTDELMEFANRLDADLYILPSSIHELIVIPVCDEADPDYLCRMVKEINETELCPSEILSDNIYRFQRSDEKVQSLFSA